MSSEATVCIEAIFTFPDPLEKRRALLEARMPISELLCGQTVDDALRCFLDHTDVVTAAESATSIKIDGYEIIETFMRRDTVSEMLRIRRQTEEMTRLLRRSTEALEEARAQRDAGGHIQDDVLHMLEKTISAVGKSLQDSADHLGLNWRWR